MAQSKEKILFFSIQADKDPFQIIYWLSAPAFNYVNCLLERSAACIICLYAHLDYMDKRRNLWKNNKSLVQIVSFLLLHLTLFQKLLKQKNP